MRNYKETRDDFAHSDGTTAYETYSVILPAVFLCFITSLLMSLTMKPTNSTFPILRLLFEFILIIIPIILDITIFAQYATNIVITLAVISISLYFMMLRRKASETQTRPKRKLDNSKQDFITLARSTVSVMSIIGILAVDFRIFPRTFAKTKNYGYSLMDTGVGLYVAINGMVAPEIKGHRNSFRTTLKSVIPLLVIGVGRFLITKKVDYHVPVSEYGVHWNFFITLAIVKILSSLILNMISVENSIFSGVSMLLAHEIILQLGLTEYVLSDIRRNTFLKANREGFVSSLGYLGLYCLGVAFGKILNINRKFSHSKFKFSLKLCVISGFLLWATMILEKNFGVSRRLANSGYCIWVLFIMTSMVTLFYLGELIQDFLYERSSVMSYVKVPLIFEAINYNGLVFFLLGNVLTGLINMSMDTLKTNTVFSLMIIVTYMFINCSISYVLFARKIKLKL